MEIPFLILLVMANLLLVIVLLRLLKMPRQSGGAELQKWLEERLAAQDEVMEKRMQQQNAVMERQFAIQSEALDKRMSRMRAELTQTNMQATQNLGMNLQQSVRYMGKQMNESQTGQMQLLEQRLKTMESTNEQKLEAMRTALNTNMETIRTENSKKLDEIRHTVDEQLQDALQKRLKESFESVSQQLEQVYKGLGEMQNLAADVGGLKQVLSGVKTRGILGEIQLGSILEEILAPEQYETNIATVPGSTQRVEYAVKMPGQDGGTVWLPIDAKFPGDTYVHLQDAYTSGDVEQIEAARRALSTVVCSEAKDIRTKYVAPPDTTNFGILFLPFEGLYAEVVNLGLVEKLQRDYQVNIAGPSTMAALLNSLQMGFRTLAIQKRSNEVWQVLAAVKTEFDKFADGLSKMQQRLRQTDDELDKLIGVRTRAINRKLRNVQQLESPADASTILELSAGDWEE